MEQARIAVKALRCDLGGGRPVWLDVSRRHAEMRPLRMRHKIADFLSEHKAALRDRLALTRDGQARAVIVGGSRVVFLSFDVVI